MPAPENRTREGRFQSGRSGNPGGRPKGEIELRALAREHTEEAIEKLVELLRGGPPQVAARAAEAILDRGWGRPAQAIETTTVELSDGERVARLASIFDAARARRDGEDDTADE